MFKQKLIGQRLVLKQSKANLKTAETMFKLIEINRPHLKPWFAWEPLTLKIEDTLKYLFETEEKFKKGEKIEYGIYLNNESIGNISAFNISKEKKSTEIGYWLSAEFTRQGYMTEAIKILEKEIFTNTDINRIQIRCDERNVASAGVIKKCNYIFEGKRRQDRYSNYFKDFSNTLFFSKLKKEFKKRT